MKNLGRTLMVAATLVGTVAMGALAAEHARRERAGHGKELQQVEQQIRAGRSVTKRVQRDARASADVKQKATELDQLLDTRERTVAKLDALYRDFLSQHKAELDELEDLRKRALALDERLGEARTVLVQANRTDIDDLKRTSQQARQLVEGLRTAYEVDRRTRH
jgi:TolA-binding protein